MWVMILTGCGYELDFSYEYKLFVVSRHLIKNNNFINKFTENNLPMFT